MAALLLAQFRVQRLCIGDEQLKAACVSMLNILDRDAMGHILLQACNRDKATYAAVNMTSMQLRQMMPEEVVSRMKSESVVYGCGSASRYCPQ